MFTITDIQNEWSHDADISNESLLDKDSMAIPRLHAKYCIMLNDVKEEILNAQFDIDIREHEAKLFYGGKEIPDHYKNELLGHKILKSEISDWMAVDPYIVRARVKLERLRIMKEFLTEILKMLQLRSYHLNTALEAMKFYQGYVA